MAKTIAICEGRDSSRVKTEHRLGSICSTGKANTWRTFATAHVNADGSGFLSMLRDGKILYYIPFTKEAE